jgi:hypothetical protein
VARERPSGGRPSAECQAARHRLEAEASWWLHPPRGVAPCAAPEFRPEAYRRPPAESSIRLRLVASSWVSLVAPVPRFQPEAVPSQHLAEAGEPLSAWPWLSEQAQPSAVAPAVSGAAAGAAAEWPALTSRQQAAEAQPVASAPKVRSSSEAQVAVRTPEAASDVAERPPPAAAEPDAVAGRPPAAEPDAAAGRPPAAGPDAAAVQRPGVVVVAAPGVEEVPLPEVAAAEAPAAWPQAAARPSAGPSGGRRGRALPWLAPSRWALSAHATSTSRTARPSTRLRQAARCEGLS